MMQNKYVPFFETQIRYFGGLLSSYHFASISAHEDVREAASILRAKAEELGEAMLLAFDTESGLPAASVDTSRYAVYTQPNSIAFLFSLSPYELTVVV
jgi:mannosyl-oligosaccharide alpha-1,2-mannosidase